MRDFSATWLFRRLWSPRRSESGAVGQNSQAFWHQPFLARARVSGARALPARVVAPGASTQLFWWLSNTSWGDSYRHASFPSFSPLPGPQDRAGSLGFLRERPPSGAPLEVCVWETGAGRLMASVPNNGRAG